MSNGETPSPCDSFFYQQVAEPIGLFGFRAGLRENVLIDEALLRQRTQ